MEEKRKNALTRWLETLQQESWQLELLISGFAIFLLIGSLEPVRSLRYDIDLLASGGEMYQILYIPYNALLGSWFILVINLIIHILLRGLWISTIGLRYVSGDVDFDILRFTTKFDQFLKKKITSFDIYIHQLEKLCSIIFAFTFLIIFILISIGLFVGIMAILIYNSTLFQEKVSYGFADIFFIAIICILLLGAGIYFVDFITLGWIKRKKKFAQFYYPIYRFYGLITLAFLYRPLYYNLIDNNFGRRVVLFLIPYSALLLLFVNLSFKTHAYLPIDRQNQTLDNIYYEDSRDTQIGSFAASIPSKFVSNGYIPLFLPYNPLYDDKVIQEICPHLKPAQTGVLFFERDDPTSVLMNAEAALECHSKRFRIYVNDSLYHNSTYRFYEHPTYKKTGLLTILDVVSLPRGEHSIKVNVQFFENPIGTGDLFFRETAVIPFWKE